MKVIYKKNRKNNRIKEYKINKNLKIENWLLSKVNHRNGLDATKKDKIEYLNQFGIPVTAFQGVFSMKEIRACYKELINIS